MQSPSHRFDLDVFVANIDFRSATQVQLAKDFAKIDMSFPDDFTTEVYPVEKIENLISQHLLVLMEKGERHLLQLLYTIDIPEDKFLNLLSQKDFLSVLARQILYREAYKIWLRANYSS